MAIVLEEGYDLDVLRIDGEYVVLNPTGLDAESYFMRVVNSRNFVGFRFTQQIAYNVGTGDEYYRALFTNGWTDWLPRSGSGPLEAAEIISLLDAYLGGTAWRENTDLALGTVDGDSVEITSSTGDPVTIPSATDTEAGLLSAADKAALDSLSGGTLERTVSSYDAFDTVSGHRIVAVDGGKVRHADNTSLGDEDSVVGISLNAGNEDDPINVVTFGPVVHSFGFTAGSAVYLDANGALDQTPPDAAFTLRVGTALRADLLFVHLEQPIIAGS